jgi:hypothetical protein
MAASAEYPKEERDQDLQESYDDIANVLRHMDWLTAEVPAAGFDGELAKQHLRAIQEEIAKELRRG